VSRIREEIEKRVGPPEKSSPAKTYEIALRSIQAQLYSLRAGVDGALLAIRALLGDAPAPTASGACDHRKAVRIEGMGATPTKLLCPPPPDGCGEEVDA
jgi:hypothetical protein